jgi:hypothetical protein
MLRVFGDFFVMCFGVFLHGCGFSKGRAGGDDLSEVMNEDKGFGLGNVVL